MDIVKKGKGGGWQLCTSRKKEQDQMGWNGDKGDDRNGKE